MPYYNLLDDTSPYGRKERSMAKGIEPDTLYIVTDERYGTTSYATTPDGEGMYWYDTREEAEVNLPEVYGTRRVTEAQLDEARYLGEG